MSAEEPLVRVVGISKHFPGVQALRDVDFDVRPGEVHALVGENGAGKSTLIKILAGAERPDAGTIEVGGRETAIHSPADSTRLGFGFVHQDLNVVPGFSVYENMTLGLRLPRAFGVFVNWRAMRRRVREMAARLRLDVDLGSPAAALSQAQQQMIALGRALLLDARVVTFDEPTAALASAEVEQLYGIIRDLTSHDVGVVYISHRLDEVFELADRITVLRDGKLVGTFAREEISGKDQLVQLIIGRDEPERFHERATELGPVRIEARRLSWRGRVKDVSLELRGGEIAGLAGLVGSGRSELAQLLFAAEQPDSGQVLVDGKPLPRAADPAAAIRRGVALLPENRRRQGAITAMRIRENTTLASLERYRIGPLLHRRRERESVRSLVQRLGVRLASIEQPLRNLSGGNQQKVVIAKWIATGAGVYLFDEPTQGVDVGAKAEIHRLIEGLAAEGAAVLFISSDLDETVAISDRILVMREGRIVAELDRAGASVQAVLAHCYEAAVA